MFGRPYRALIIPMIAVTTFSLHGCAPRPGSLTCPANQAVDPTCSALIAAAFCQAKVPSEYGGSEIYGVSRENPDCDGIASGCLSASETRGQTCAIACEKFRAKHFPNDGPGLWGAALDAGGHAVGTADMSSLFIPRNRGANEAVRAVGGRPESHDLEGGGSAYADWCCCSRGYNRRAVVPTKTDRPPTPPVTPAAPGGVP